MRPYHFYVTVLFASALCGSVLAANSIIPSELLGVWKEKDTGYPGVLTYTFQKDHEFIFTRIFGDGSGGKKLGAWQTGKGRCDLMIHLGTDKCCHQAYFLGKNLILTDVDGYSSSSSVCADRVLVRGN